jgi:ATP-dependent RNA helicase DeaD
MNVPANAAGPDQAAPPLPPEESASIAPKPTFDVLPLSADVRRAIDALGYQHPTPVQIAVFEPAIRGKNLVVQARTGTGKTAAFGLPLIDSLVKKSIPKVQALVLTPTRELALQVQREIEKLAQFKGIHATAIYGGAPMGKQIEALEGGAQIVVGTPGRVLDHLRRGTFDASAVRIFVLDEADEMLSMGFAKELHAIMSSLPKERQGLFFSATIPPDIERMAQNQLKDPEFVTLSSDQVGALSIQHFAYIVPGDKRAALVKIVEVENPESAVIFCNTKDQTERVSGALQDAGFDAEWLNGDLEQRERERIMAKTREGKLRFLVATDVAARGIDISHLTHVINFDMPEQAESYVHRTGRTGRAGKTGTAIALVGPRDIGNLYMLRLTYGIRPIEKQLPSAGELQTRAELDMVNVFAEAFASAPPHPDDMALARRLLTHADAETIVAGLLRDHLGARVATGADPRAEASEARRAKNPAPVREEPPPPPPRAREEGREGRSGGRGERGDRERRPPRETRETREPWERDRGVAAAAPVATPVATAVTPATNDAEHDLTHGSREASDALASMPRRPERTRDRSGSPRVAHKTFTTWEPPVDADDDQPLISRQGQVAGATPVAPLTEASPLEAPPLPGFTEEPEPSTQAFPGRRERAGGERGERAGGERAERGERSDRGDRGDRDEEEPGFAQIFVNVGRRDGTKPGDLQRLLTEGAGIERKDTGRIRIRDRNSFVSVRREELDKAVGALNGQTLGGRTVIAEPAREKAT